MDSTKAEAVRDLVASRAYVLWESEGRPHGRDLINWQQAEAEIRSGMGDEGSPIASGEGAPARPKTPGRRRAVT